MSNGRKERKRKNLRSKKTQKMTIDDKIIKFNYELNEFIILNDLNEKINYGKSITAQTLDERSLAKLDTSPEPNVELRLHLYLCIL